MILVGRRRRRRGCGLCHTRHRWHAGFSRNDTPQGQINITFKGTNGSGRKGSKRLDMNIILGWGVFLLWWWSSSKSSVRIIMGGSKLGLRRFKQFIGNGLNGINHVLAGLTFLRSKAYILSKTLQFLIQMVQRLYIYLKAIQYSNGISILLFEFLGGSLLFGATCTVRSFIGTSPGCRIGIRSDAGKK